MKTFRPTNFSIPMVNIFVTVTKKTNFFPETIVSQAQAAFICLVSAIITV